MAERKSFLMRIDPALWAEIETGAQDELRSVNGQNRIPVAAGGPEAERQYQYAATRPLGS